MKRPKHFAHPLSRRFIWDTDPFVDGHPKDGSREILAMVSLPPDGRILFSSVTLSPFVAKDSVEIARAIEQITEHLIRHADHVMSGEAAK